MSLCILLSTFDRNVPLAKLTHQLISERWPNHPPVFMCGSNAPFPAERLELTDDPRDWVGITLSAVRMLIARGYQKCYLVLDDHPPMGACHEAHLNETLPGLMDRLGAATICLYGWDQRTLSSGRVLGRRDGRLQQQDRHFKWRFSLHPALWNLQALQDILTALGAGEGDPFSRSVWAFETRSGKGELALQECWQTGSYRVCGLGMLGGPHPLTRRIRRQLGFRLHDLRRCWVRFRHGEQGLAAYDRRWAWDYAFFDGPYPIYWSGVLRQGALNRDLQTFLEKEERRADLELFLEAIQS